MVSRFTTRILVWKILLYQARSYVSIFLYKVINSILFQLEQPKNFTPISDQSMNHPPVQPQLVF